MTEHYSGHDPASGCGLLIAFAIAVLFWAIVAAVWIVVT